MSTGPGKELADRVRGEVAAILGITESWAIRVTHGGWVAPDGTSGSWAVVRRQRIRIRIKRAQ